MLSTLLELAGIATLVATGFVLNPLIGAVALGAALLVVGIFVGREQ